MKLHTLLANLHSFVKYEGENPDITSIENDNRKLRREVYLFVLKGIQLMVMILRRPL